MRCPRCNTKADAGISICPNCDEILDTSFLESEVEEAALGDPTEVGPAPEASAPRASLRPARLRGGWEAKKGEPAREPEPVLSAPKGSYLNDAVDEGPPDPLAEARKSLGDLGTIFKSLPMSDRVAAGASLLLLVTLALPWRWTKADEELIGLFEAVPAALLSVGIAVLVYVRARMASGKLWRPLALGQAAAAVLGAGYCLWFVRAVNDVRMVKAAGRMIELPLSTAEPAAYAGLLCAAVAAVASVAVLGERR